MTVHLMLRNENQPSELNAVNSAAIQAVSQHKWGMVTIDDETVASIAWLVGGVVLTNGETVKAYISDDDQDQSGTFVPGFGPSLLPAPIQDKVRDCLAAGQNSELSIALFDEMIRRGLQIALQGSEERLLIFDDEVTSGFISGENFVADGVPVSARFQ